MAAETFASNMSDRDLAARLIRMGAIAPMDLDTINRDRIEELVAGLPTVYACRYTATDLQGATIQIDCFDLTPEGLNRQMLHELAGQKLQTVPEHTLAEYSPEAWKGFLQRDFDSVDRKPLLKQFRRWGMPLDSKKVRNGFCNNPELNEQRAVEMLKADQTDLLSRLVRMGVVEPMDLENVSIPQADEIIKSLPALIESEIVWQGENDYERRRFINLAEFHIGSRGFQDIEDPFSEGVTDDELRIPLHEEERPIYYSNEGALQGPNVRSSAHTLHLQENRFISSQDGLEDRIIHRREEITGGYVWLDYFRQGQEEALPNRSTKALRNAFKTWGIQLKRGTLELGFSKDAAANREEAMLSYYKVLIQKVVNAGIAEAIPKKDWYSLDRGKAEKFISKIPLLLEQESPGEWLSFFKQSPPADALEMALLEKRFHDADVPFDEELVRSSFQIAKASKKQPKGIRTMQDITTDDYKKMIGRLTSSGRMERLGNEEFKNLSLEDARDYVRGFDDPATEKQKVLLRSMGDENRINISENDLNNLSKMEASFIVDHAPQQEISVEKPEHPVTDETKHELQRLINNGETPQIPWQRFNNLSEEDARSKIDQVYARRPASDKQKDFIQAAVKDGSISPEIIEKVMNVQSLSDTDIKNLNQLQASKLIGGLPATEKQIEAVKRLVDEKRIEPLENYSLSAAETNKILDRAYRDGTERDPNSPATERQKEALEKLLEQKQLPPEMTKEAIDNMTFAEAGKVLENAPASRGQKDMISRLVHEGKLPSIPRQEFTNMNRATASLLIDVGTNKRPQTDLPKFEEIDYPASDSQMKLLNDLKEKGKIQEIPENVTSKMASQMITDSMANDPIAPHQLSIIEKKIANNQLPAMSEKELSGLTQGDFTRLMKESRSKEAATQEQQKPAQEHSKNKGRSKQGAGISR